MLHSLQSATKNGTNQLLSIPIDGRWIWDEKKKELVYESQKRINEDRTLKSNEVLKIDIRFGQVRYQKQHRSLQPILKTNDDSRITLDNVIQASINVMSEMFYIPVEFEEYVRMQQVQEFLLYLLNYFYWFFETFDEKSQKNERYIDRSLREKDRIHIAYANLLITLRELGCKYAVLLLGINLKDFHHMRNGDLHYSCTHIDQSIFESLFIFSTYFTWITFYRQHFNSIRHELARLFRADGDVEMLQIPMTETLEGRMKNDTVNNSMNRHRLIDCTEIFSNSMAKKAAIARISEANNSKKLSVRHTSSIFFNLNENPAESILLTKQNGLKNILARDLNSARSEENNELNVNSPGHRQRHKPITSQRKNRIRSILTKQIKNRNQSLIEEQFYDFKMLEIGNKKNEPISKAEIERKVREREKLKRERLIKQQILKSTFHQPSFLLPPPPNPLFSMKGKQSNLSEVDFQLKENIGIIGKCYFDFDLIRLTLKPNSEDTIDIPKEFTIESIILHHN